MIDLLFRALTRKDFEAMARTAQFLDDTNGPMPGVEIDPTPGSPGYELGLPIVEVPSPDEVTPPTMKSGWHCNVRLSGAREAKEIEGLDQYDSEGKLLPAAQRTHFGIAFGDAGTVVADGTTEGVSYTNVALINEQTVASPQRVWQ